MAKKTETRGERNVRWIEENLKIPEGKMVGQPVRLTKFQKDAVLQIYDNPAGTRRAIVSLGRKNGKSWMAAAIALLHLVGPESLINGQLFSTAQSREQAAIVFALALKMVLLSPRIKPFVVPRESRKELLCPRRGTVYRALSKESKTALGFKPDLVIHDELGQVSGPRSALYEAMETASGASAEPLSIVISTQAATDGDLLSLLIDSALTGEDPRVVCVLHTAPMDMDPFSDEALLAGNPAFLDFQNADELRAMAADAKRMPSREAEYRNLILNQRVETESPFIARAIWEENADAPDPIDGMEVIGGLDLSEISDLTAFVGVFRKPDSDDKRWSVFPVFWLPSDGLEEKARKEKVVYDIWRDKGDLVAVPGRVIDYDYVAAWLYELSKRCVLKKIAFDAWKWAQFRPALIRAGFADSFVDSVFSPFRQGFKSMGPAVRKLEGMILQNELKHGNHPVLTMCVANATVLKDPAGNRKLIKHADTRKIDGAVALAMAVATIEEAEAAVPKKSYLEDDDMLVLW